MPTKGGFLLDVAVTIDNRETRHRVIVGEAPLAGPCCRAPCPMRPGARDGCVAPCRVLRGAGRQYVDGMGLTSPEPACEAAFSVLLGTKQARHTEGIMPVGQFPVNYFTVSEVEQWWADAFGDAFKIAAGALS